MQRATRQPGPIDVFSMQLQDIRFAGQRLIESYGQGGFRLTNGGFQGSIIILPQTVETFAARFAKELAVWDFDLVFDAGSEIEILLLGTGEKQYFPPREIIKAFIERGIALECMDTGAACRTYNVLVSENRRVSAALIAV